VRCSKRVTLPASVDGFQAHGADSAAPLQATRVSRVAV
jgi:hypothetical protein